MLPGQLYADTHRWQILPTMTCSGHGVYQLQFSTWPTHPGGLSWPLLLPVLHCWVCLCGVLVAGMLGIQQVPHDTSHYTGTAQPATGVSPHLFSHAQHSQLHAHVLSSAALLLW